MLKIHRKGKPGVRVVPKPRSARPQSAQRSALAPPSLTDDRVVPKPRSTRPQSAQRSALAPPSLTDDRVVVSMPTWNVSEDLIRRAIRSLLDGSHRNVTVAVVGDGIAVPDLGSDLLSDPRVVTWSSRHNHGPYFNHDVVLRASPTPLFAVADSDDTSHPSRLTSLLDSLLAQRADAAFGSVLVVNGRSETVEAPRPIVDSRRFQHRAHHFGLFSREALLQLGGYFAGVRVGFDTLITSSLLLLGKVTCINDVIYTRHTRSGSLTMDPATGFGSPLRRASAAQLKRIWDAVCVVSDRKQAIRKHRAELERGAAPTRTHRDAAIRELAPLLAVRDVPAASRALLEAAISAAPPSSWAISTELARHLFRSFEQHGPKTIVDVGSGLSTMVLALYASRNAGTKVLSLEHDAEWYRKTKSALASVGLLRFVDLRLCPLRSFGTYTWYDVDVRACLGERNIDACVIDGPPEAICGREGAMLHLDTRLAQGARLWLHDGTREGERRTVASWKAKRSMATNLRTDLDPRGVWEIQLL